MNMQDWTPQTIVAELDRYIVGQSAAKRAVAIALRNRWRRQQVEPVLRQEITPKNILLIGPTGVGKTEIARRLAKISQAPFIKVEATKFTEVGYVGKDVDSIIRDLIEIAVKECRELEISRLSASAQDAAEDRVLDVLIPSPRASVEFESTGPTDSQKENLTRQIFRKKLREGLLNDREIDIEISDGRPQLEIMGPTGMEEMAEQIRGMFSQMATGRSQIRRMKIIDALRLLTEEEAIKQVNDDEIKKKAIANAEQNGIIFIDEIDKVASRSNTSGVDVSRQGVQRDLLPLVEGTTVSTKYGMVKTDHMLFIASGAFHLSRPSDLIPELQGRFPIRVELQSLTVEDFEAILTVTDANLIRQYQALLMTEGVKLNFLTDGITRLAQLACDVNERTENIGARRLSTVMERLLEDISFEASVCSGSELVIDAAYVEERLGTFIHNDDLARFIL
jgi:ATP-dependent HslUV protease ATP-binding subunit HslU